MRHIGSFEVFERLLILNAGYPTEKYGTTSSGLFYHSRDVIFPRNLWPLADDFLNFGELKCDQ